MRILLLLLLTSCSSQEFMCCYQTNVIDMRYQEPDKLGHYQGEKINKYGDLRVEWETGKEPKGIKHNKK